MGVLIRGRPFHVHPDGDYVSDWLRSGKAWEPDIVAAVTERVTHRPGVIVDAGAMIGTHTVAWAVDLPRHTIHAVEPWRANLRLLERNVAALPNVTVHPLALSDRAGKVRLWQPDRANAGHVMEGHGYAFRCCRLDSLGLRDVRAIKVDVEGSELRVLAGARKTIERDRPVIVVEDWEAVCEKPLEAMGYRLAQGWPDQQTYLYDH